MAGNLPRKGQTGQQGLGRVSIDDFVLQLKELQLLYGPAITWKFNYPGRRIKVVLKTDKGFVRTVVARLSNAKLDGGHPDMVTSIRLKGANSAASERFFNLSRFKNFVIGTIEKT